jgi:hypothetical protein
LCDVICDTNHLPVRLQYGVCAVVYCNVQKYLPLKLQLLYNSKI